jgi:hypothetical protein
MSCQCSKCNSEMEEGFLLEKGDGPLLSPETWVAGKPTESFISGLNLKNKVIYEVVTFRCKTCGYLESYAFKAP